jgi:nicotinate dehydrogenase subunit B
MSFNRRDFLKTVSAASLAVGITSCGEQKQEDYFITAEEYSERPHNAEYFQHEQVQWLLINKDSTVTALTGRAEMGQGAMTLMASAVSQAMKLPLDQVEIVMGDSEITPDNGPTNGSSTTILVVWPFWIACHKVIEKMKQRAADQLGAAAESLVYEAGKVWTGDKADSIAIGELQFDQVLMLDVPPGKRGNLDAYKDLKIGNILGPEIVTGRLQYVADLFPEKIHYGGFLPHKYHYGFMDIEKLDLRAAKKIPGVLTARKISGFPAVVANSYSSLQRGLEAIDVTWKKPARPKKYDPVGEIRTGRKLVEVIQDKGDAAGALAAADRVLKRPI